ncbi:MAG: phosphopantothenoylcysteine decarboxylase [Verrucomicrobiaceae bacterium]|nr:phosphopantothenoylcysteine decarboxylase [Verrucomicrobiaceae bacterium]
MKILITAGPTREALDPVRYLSNRSSGKMGYALAEAARDAGHDVVLVTGPVSITPPDKVQVVRVESAAEMFEAVRTHLSACDVAIFAAAVADYRPAEVAPQKIKKATDELVLHLVRTPDILGSARGEFGFKGVLVGFAAETTDLIAHAQDKCLRKRCDLIVANDVSQPGIGFDSSDNAVTLCFADGTVEPIAQASKSAIARGIVTVVERLQKHRDSARD